MPEPLQISSGPRTLDAAVRIAELAGRQSGVVARAQLLAAGMSDAGIARAVRRRALLRMYPGVYAVGHGAVDVNGRLRAALMHAGASAVLSHTTAGWWWGIVEDEPEVIHLSAPVRRARADDVRVHLPRRVSRTSHRGLPVTPVRRTLLDLASMLSLGRLRRAVAEADRRDLLRPADVFSVLGRGREGSPALREALELHLPELARVESALEFEFLALVARHDLPRPQVQARIGPFRVDALWPAARVVVELDGHRFHAGPAEAEADRRRDLELRGMGYVVLRYTWHQVTREGEAVIADLRRALGT
jgi:very-short-patch-repair endonuclease